MNLQVLISGDMMLPRISTNVSVYDVEPESNALASFLESIDRFAPLPADTLTLPSHGKPFRGLHARIAQLHAHRDRLAEVLDACRAAPQSAAPMCCRCCSSASWICTRPPLPWANRWPICRQQSPRAAANAARKPGSRFAP
jgi:glyoxylase-like metal-dependent hydrolase (beta-lactamase superfamily II)